MIYRFCNNNARDLLKGNKNQDNGDRKKRKFEGKIIVITGVPGMGYLALCLDTENNSFGIWETDQNAK
jgi:predicted enzyme related to lactoylglutathione lyase